MPWQMIKAKIVIFHLGLGNKLIFAFPYINYLICITKKLYKCWKQFKTFDIWLDGIQKRLYLSIFNRWQQIFCAIFLFFWKLKNGHSTNNLKFVHRVDSVYSVGQLGPGPFCQTLRQNNQVNSECWTNWWDLKSHKE